jgi:hypothetical protein
MSISRRFVLTGAAILALGAAGGGAVAWAQESEGTGSESTSAVEPSGDDSTVSTEGTTEGTESTTSEPAGDDTTVTTEATNEGEAPVATATEGEASFTG